MRYEDASHAGAFTQGSEPDARNDADAIAAGSRVPATGNVITGEGTQTGPSGADAAVGAHITTIAGAGGEDSSFAGGKLAVSGEFGRLSIDAEGNYSYQAKANTPENSRDLFTYTLADNQGNSDTATLTIEIGKTPAVIKANAQQVVPGPDGVVVLPAGVELSDVHIVGRNLVIDLPDGSQMVIIDGAVFVPQLVLNGVEVPASNLAALLIGQEIAPAAGDGPPQSSGGNFAVPVGPLDPGVPLGDLIPPTEYTYTPPEVREVFDVLDREPEIFIQPNGQPATISAVDSVNERGLPTRNGGEPAGSGEIADGNGSNNSDPSEATTGTIVYSSPDGVASITLNGVAITSVGQVFVGTYGTLTITSIAPGVIGYNYVLNDNTSGDATHDNFSVVLTDQDGDVASATLTINIIDDTPTARPDTDAVAAGTYGPETGNVLTGDGTTSGVAGADTVGADNATLTGVTGAGSSTPFPGGFTVNGQYGVLTINTDGSYSYVRNDGTPGGVNDVFNYTLTDGDGDTSTTTLTISIGDATPRTGENPPVLLDDDALPGGIPGGTGDDPDGANLSGTLAASGGDGPLTYDLLLTGAPAGFTYVDGPAGSVLVQQSGVTVLTITINPATGAYTVTQNAPILHAAGGDENNQLFTITYRVTDVDGDPADGTLVINVDDDTPTVGRADVQLPGLLVDETDLTTNASADFSVVFAGQYGADGPGTTNYALVVVNGTDSGLVDVGTGLPVLLYNIGGVVTGSTSVSLAGVTAGNTVFTVSVNSGTGVVTLDQIRALDHPSNPNPNDPVSPNASSIQLAVTVTDADGDPASLAVNIGGQLVFLDDGPSVDISLSAVGEPTLITQDSETDGDPTSQDSATASFAANFTVSANGGADGLASQSIAYTLGVSAPGVDSGLDHAGANIYLYLIGGVVVGSTSATQAGVNVGNTVFNVSVDGTGNVTLTQFSQIDHPLAGDPSPSGAPFTDHLATLADSLVTLTATVTVTDGDGDPASDSQSLNIGANLVFQDDGPDISAVLTGNQIRIDETDGVAAAGGEIDPPGGNLGTVTVAAATLFTVSNLNLSADTPTTLSYGLVLSGQGVDSGLLLSTTNAPIYLYDIGGGVIAGSTSVNLAGVNAGNTVFTASINSSTGAVTLTQFLAVEHFNTSSNDEDSSPLTADALQVRITATDFDGDTDVAQVDLGSIIRFEDDGPTIDVTKGSDANIILTTDDADTIGAATDTASTSANFGGVFGLTFTTGSDGAAAPTLMFSLGVSAPGVDSGLDQGGANIYLYTIGGKVVGSTSATQAGVTAGNTVFDVGVSATGVVTLSQYSQIDHPPAGDPTPSGAPFADHILSMADGLITLTASATITDNDGDTASDSETVNIGANLRFTDDGPDVNAVLTGTQIRIDETDGVVAAGGEVDPVGGNLGTVTMSLASLVNVTQPHVSADGPTALAYSLSLSSQGVASGLLQSAANAPIYLYDMGGGVVAGSTSVTLAGVNAGNTVFTVSINSGTGAVTVTQFQAIEHFNTSSNDEDSLPFAAGVLNLKVTATDFDGDTDVAQVDLGSVIRFEDDGPTAVNDFDTIVGGNGPATGNVITGIDIIGGDANSTDGSADNVGQDTPGRITAIASDNVPGNVDTDPSANFTIAGQHGVLTLNANGDYSYLRNDGSPGGVNDVFTYTLTDADGDSVTAKLTISIEDKFPVAGNVNVQLDDDALAGGNPGGVGDDPNSVNANGTLPGSGGDGALTFGVLLTGAPAGFTYVSGGAGIVLVQQGAVTVLTITVNSTTGAYSVVQNAPILHPTLNGGPGDDTENNVQFTVNYTVTDADGDVAPGTISIDVDDDTPTVDVTKGSDAGIILTTDDADTIGAATDTASTSANFGGVFGLNQSAGADGTNAAATLMFSLGVSAPGVDSGLDQGGANIYLYSIGGKVVGSTSATQAGVTAGNTVFDVGVSGTGVVTLTQYSQIDHPVAGDPTPGGAPYADHIVSMVDSLITLTASATLTDKDGDTATDSETVNIGANLRFTDHGPSATVDGTAALDTIILDETRPVGTDTAGGGAPNGLASSTANFADNFVAPINYGADGAGTATYSLVLSANGIGSGLYALQPSDTSILDGDGYGQGAQITLSQSGNTITGSVGLVTYFTISINPATGVVTFTQVNPIWHPTTGSSFDETATLTTAAASNIQVVQTVTDFDGDTASAGLNIGQGVFKIQDDGPNAIQPDSATLNNEVGAMVTADLDDDGEVLTDFGEDGAGLVRFANITNGQNSGLTSDDDVITYWLSNNGQTLQGRTNSTNGVDGELVLTVQINQGTGDYTVTLADTIDNGAGVTFNNLTSTKAGNVDVRAVGADDPATTVDLLLTASGPGGVNATINTSSSTVGSANQSMDQGETVRIDFVTNAQTNAGLPSGFSYDDHVGTSSLLQAIPQVQGNQAQTVAFRVYALNTTVTDAGSPDDYPGDGFSDASIVTVTSVTIDGFGVGETPVTVAIGAVGVWTPIAYGVFAQLQADGSVIFTGVQEGDQYGIGTGTDFNAFAVTSLPAGVGPVGNVSSTNSFDLGVFSIGSVDTGDPINLHYDLSITDADGDTLALPGAIDITINPAGTMSLAAFSTSQEQLMKTAANSNTTLLAAAVAASGLAGTQAAAVSPDDSQGHGHETAPDSSSSASFASLSVDSGEESRVALSNETKEAANDDAQVQSNGHGNSDHAQSAQGLDNAAAHAPASSNAAASAEHGPAVAADAAGPVAPAVAMVSAEALKTAGLEGNAQHGGSVEKVLAEALGHGGPPTVDNLLQAIGGAHGNGGVPGLAHVASPAADAVPAWDMGSAGAFGHGADVVIAMGAQMLHHDAVQPAVNG